MTDDCEDDVENVVENKRMLSLKDMLKVHCINMLN